MGFGVFLGGGGGGFTSYGKRGDSLGLGGILIMGRCTTEDIEARSLSSIRVENSSRLGKPSEGGCVWEMKM